ncbi:hypothetical protein [Nitrosarchaeum sp. AC2]|uniref:hypothetical protein n=1 Tax=Nitrosarchaeum sp. AC2 TaxID=2259673 RepID=UPI0021059E75|nr:hypothetical protein [Nitrosarchaeum sp. AC2]
MLNSDNTWSDWLDFNEETISKIPQSAGVYMMHASMKILFIGGSENIKKAYKKKKKNHASQKPPEYDTCKLVLMNKFQRI